MTGTRINWSPEYTQKVLRAAALTLYMERTSLHHEVTRMLPNVREVRDLAQILDNACMQLEPSE